MLKLTNLQSTNIELTSKEKLAAVKGGDLVRPLTFYSWAPKRDLGGYSWTPKRDLGGYSVFDY